MAGGYGTRLKNVVKNLPKPMADINGTPFLSYLMDFLSRSGVTKVVLSVGYLSEAILDFFGEYYQGIRISYAVEKKPLGTGGAIRESIKLVDSDVFFILNGDTFFNVDLNNLYSAHKFANNILTLSLKPMTNFERYGEVLIEEDRIRGFREKVFTKKGFINGGVYCAKKEIVQELDRYGQTFSFETDFLQKQFMKLDLRTFVSDGYFIDIGLPEDYEKAKKDFPTALIIR